MIVEQILAFVSTHPATRLRGNVVTTPLYTSKQRRRYVSNETPNNVSVERRQVVSVARLHNVLLERYDDVLRGRYNDTLSAHLHDFLNKFQMKLSGTYSRSPSLYDVSCKSQMKHPIKLLWYVSTTSRSYVVAMVSRFASYFVMSSI